VKTDSNGDATGVVDVSFPDEQAMRDFYNDVHGVVIPSTKKRLSLRVVGERSTDATLYDDYGITHDEYANMIVDEYFLHRSRVHGESLEDIVIKPRSGLVADETDEIISETEEGDVERDFKVWLEGWYERELRMRIANGVLKEGTELKGLMGRSEEEEGEEEENIKLVYPPKEGRELDEFEVMDNLSYTGRTGAEDELSPEDRANLDKFMAQWDEDDDEHDPSQGRRYGGRTRVGGVSRKQAEMWERAYNIFVKRLREEEGWREYYDQGGIEMPKEIGMEGEEEDWEDDGEIKDSGEDDNPFNPAPIGDWGETIVKVDRVQKVTKGGTIVKYRSLVVCGNNKGAGGYGVGKGESPREALLLASRNSRRGLVFVDRYSGTALAMDCVGRHNGCKVVIRAVPPGYGMKAGRLVREILLQFGIADASAKAYGNRNPYSVVRATLKALKDHEGVEVIARKRGKRIMSLKRAKRLEIS